MGKDHSTAIRKVSLDDKYALDTTRAYMTGIEALVRLPMLQQLGPVPTSPDRH